ncbi:MAG: RpiB/LacA/LacB family sugar-phosphate isomerase [Gemmataceae bacterium]
MSQQRAKRVVGVAVEGTVPTVLRLAMNSLRRQNVNLVPLPIRATDVCAWVRRITHYLGQEIHAVLMVCHGNGSLSCCVANKVPGVRAAVVTNVFQAEEAVCSLGVNVLIVPEGATFFEFKRYLELCAAPEIHCPPEVATMLGELDGHAHR